MTPFYIDNYEVIMNKENFVVNENGGVKEKKNKLRYDLVPFDVTDKVVETIDFDIKNNNFHWKLVNYRTHVSIALNHISQFRQGIIFNKKSNLHHLAHATSRLMYVIWYFLDNDKNIEDLYIDDVDNIINYDVLPFDVFDKIVEVMGYGANKYDDFNWKKVSIHDYIAATLRHISKFQQGEVFDKESGFHHLSHAATDLIYALWHELRRLENEEIENKEELEEIKMFYNNGQLKEHYFLNENNQYHGECKLYYDNGQLGSHYFYKNNKLHGEYKLYWNNSNGQLYEHLLYENGKLIRDLLKE